MNYTELEEMRRVWHRMDIARQRKRAERRVEIITFLIACVLIALMAWWAGNGFPSLMEVLK